MANKNHKRYKVRKINSKKKPVIPKFSEPPKYIEDWDELIGLESETHVIEVDKCKCSGWIHPKEDDENFDNSHYLSTHTFYGHEYKRSTRILQECGFNVELANWDA